MPTLSSFDYAIVRVVPYVEREEFVNVGAILFCRTQCFLAAKIELDRQRLAALAPDLDLNRIQAHLDLIPSICAGNGPIGQLDQSERFQWLVAARSTTIQVSPVHSGLCTDPMAALNHLMAQMVRLPGAKRSLL